MFRFVFFLCTFFSSTFFATINSLNKKTRAMSVIFLGAEINSLDALKQQYQKIENNSEILEELSKKCEHIGHTLEYYKKQVASIIDSEKNEVKKESELKSLLHDGKFILDQLDDYLN